MVDKFVVGCYGIVFDAGRLLMVRQQSGLWAKKWTAPGGIMKTGDSFEKCVENEILLKTACRVRAKKWIMTTPYNTNGSLFEKHIVIYFYLCSLIEKPDAYRNDGSIIWVDKEGFDRICESGSIPVQVLNAISAINPKKDRTWHQNGGPVSTSPTLNGLKLMQSIRQPKLEP
jgi:ADP-ribose pyrophosphatase